MINKLITTIYAQVPLLYKTQETKSRWEVEGIAHKGWNTLGTSLCNSGSSQNRPITFGRTIIILLNRKNVKTLRPCSSARVLIQVSKEQV
jgi:hypothetical protein